MLEMILMLSMAFFLGLAAWFDANGRDVPDPCTVPYAMLGIAMSALKGRYMLVCVAAVLLIAIIQPYRPKWLLTMSEQAVDRAYPNTKSREQDELEHEQQAEAFYKKYSPGLDQALSVAYTVVPALIALATLLEKRVAEGFCFLFISLGGFILYRRYLEKMADEPEDETEVEQVTAIGEADIIVIIGVISFYGFEVSMLCGLIVTLLASLIWALGRKLIAGKDTIGVTLIPFFALCMPLRLIIALLSPF